MAKKSPHPVDVYVGGRVRFRRSLIGMSQDKLGDALGLTFQQVQKYEKGVNRIGASRIFEIAKVLDVPIEFFFDGFDGHRVAHGFAESDDGQFMQMLHSPEAVQLCRYFADISDPKVKKRVLELVKTLADGENHGAPAQKR
jgi:transcriptional regulator with XRE-family HTH domain